MNHRNFLLAIVPLFFCGLVAAAEPVTYYVAPDGNDVNAGTVEKPFATIAHARDVIRGPRTGDVRVILRGGRYTVTESIDFGPADCGNEQHAVTYQAFKGETPVIDASTPLELKWEQWADHPSTFPEYIAHVPKGMWFQVLFVDDKPLPRSRLPVTGFYKAIDPDQSTDHFSYDSKQADIRIGAGDKPTAIIRTYQWDEEILPVKPGNDHKDQITLARAASYPIVPKGGGVTGEFAIENLYPTQPGEWCLNAGGELVLTSKVGEGPGKTFRAGINRIIFGVHGDAAHHQVAQNLHFEGLTFTGTGRIEHLEWGGYEGQAIRLSEGVHNCTIRNCTFVHLGARGVTLWRDCQHITIDGCVFHHIADSAIQIFDYLGEGPANSGFNTIENNDIHDCGTLRHCAAGIDIAMSRENRIAHNHVHDLPYIGICVDGMNPTNWQAKFEPSLQPPFTLDRIRPFIPTEGNVVEFNHVDHVMQDMSDGGAIYFWGEMGVKPNIVNHNLVEDVGTQPKQSAVGIYMDDYCSDVQIHDNVVIRACWALHLHGTYRIRVENNIFAFATNCDFTDQSEAYNTEPQQNAIVRNIFYKGTGDITPEWIEWKRKPLAEFDYNLWWRPADKAVKLDFGQGFNAHSVVADPKFIDPAHPERGLQPDRPGFKLGFKTIELTEPTTNPK